MDLTSTPHYRIGKGTTCWLSIPSGDMPFQTTKTVIYTDADLLCTIDDTYHFRLPSNDKNASHLIVRKEDVNHYDQIMVIYEKANDN